MSLSVQFFHEVITQKWCQVSFCSYECVHVKNHIMWKKNNDGRWKRNTKESEHCSCLLLRNH